MDEVTITILNINDLIDKLLDLQEAQQVILGDILKSFQQYQRLLDE